MRCVRHYFQDFLCLSAFLHLFFAQLGDIICFIEAEHTSIFKPSGARNKSVHQMGGEEEMIVTQQHHIYWSFFLTQLLVWFFVCTSSDARNKKYCRERTHARDS